MIIQTSGSMQDYLDPPDFSQFRSTPKMTAVGESDPNLATKCLDFCQALSSQGVAFNFSLSISSTFFFSLDTRGKAPMASGTKKKSPSTLRRNARRRREFLEKKQNPVAVLPSEVVEAKVFKCEQQRRSETKQSLIISDRSLIISDRSLIISDYQINIFQLDFPFLLLSISQYLEFCIYDCYFSVGFPFTAVKYFSKFGILHLRMPF